MANEAHDPFRPKEQRAYVHGFDVEIKAHPCGGWTFEVWDVDHRLQRAQGAADSESSVKMLAVRVAGDCAARRDGRKQDIQTLPPFLDHKPTEGGADVE